MATSPPSTLDPPRAPSDTQLPPHPSIDYTTWSHSSLLARVTELEAQLRARTQSITSPSPSPLPHRTISSPSQPPRSDHSSSKTRIDRPFESSRYTTRFIALKFAYIGTAYNGYEHHARNTTPLPTVEEVLFRALRRGRLVAIPSGEDYRPDEEVCWDGLEYSKCGRTDKGVSAFGQVIGIRVRSARPVREVPDTRKNETTRECLTDEDEAQIGDVRDDQAADIPHPLSPPFDDVSDELPYIHILNRLLPPSIRILAWCPHPPPDFSARFSCRERQYRYFFTQPAFAPSPNSVPSSSSSNPSVLPSQNGHLDIPSMRLAASHFLGLHDFRNFCKIDASKQITNFERRIFSATIEEVPVPPRYPSHPLFRPPPTTGSVQDTTTTTCTCPSSAPSLYSFNLRGSAFLWHQVRHMVAILFLIGQGLEPPSLVRELLDVQSTKGKPLYEMADEKGLVLWNCVFPSLDSDQEAEASRHDALEWIYDSPTAADGGIFASTGLVDVLWRQYRSACLSSVLWGGLLDVAVAAADDRMSVLSSEEGGVGAERGMDGEGRELEAEQTTGEKKGKTRGNNKKSRSVRVFDGGDVPKLAGLYVPVMQKKRGEEVEVLNERYRERKGRQAG